MDGENDLMIIEGNSDNFGVKAMTSMDATRRFEIYKIIISNFINNMRLMILFELSFNIFIIT